MTAIHGVHRSETATRLHLAFELGWSQWKLAFTIGHGQPPRMRTIQARDLERLLQEIVHAKRRFDLPENAELVSCYEAGRDGFWLHRWLTSQGIANVSKAGNKHVRRLLIELAWYWLRWQPGSDLSQWYERRFAHHGPRARKVGIVALARKLLIAFWRFLETGEAPPGARLANWRAKVNAKATGAPVCSQRQRAG